ncbi:histone-lysine N-methyltransferase SETD2 [Halyomorpha halys]|uniref:histone-lysine N-methyltransferase SETD2 n=2 Tax=Halyomorpha halys TaxID=286706 RepID=UPI0006D4D02C|nr:histone-lysine N-methyltransferase SETD2 isoform X2 [Halyomorpha halys]
MARKRRSNKVPAKRNNRKKSDSDQNSNGVSDENEVDNKQDSNSDDLQNSSSNSTNNEKSHKRFGKYRCLERRHSSSQDEECEYNTNDLMPQEIQDIVLGDVKDVIISQDDIANDTCLQGDVEHEEVIEETIECESSEVLDDVDIVESSEMDIRTGSINVDLNSASETLIKSDIVKDFEKNVNITSSVEFVDSIIEQELVPDVNMQSAKSCLIDYNALNGIAINEELIKKYKLKEEENADKSVIEETKKNDDKKKNVSEEPLRRSSRIRVNRSNDEDSLKTSSLNEMNLPPPIQQSSLFDLDKPVKVKSRWRRTSELEMGGTSGCGLNSDGEQNTGSSLSNPELPPLDPEVEERLKCFEIISHNVFLTPRSKSKEAKRMICDCSLTKEEVAKGEMGCGEDCLNRLLMIECGSRCILGNQCSNKRFQNCQYTKCQVIKTAKKGLGLITTTNVVAGTFLMEYVGEVLDHKEFRRRAKEYAKEKNAHYYFMALKSDTIIDATVKGNISRFINHSCDPNAETQKWTVNGELRIGFFSKRPIAKGEEITFDYQLQRYGKEAQKCYCDSRNCRGWIGEDPDKEKDREKKDWSSRKERKEKKRKEEKRRELREFLNDMDLEEEIEKLSGSGVKNQKHTLTLSRLMVRTEDEMSRHPLLEIAQAADPCCKRLFLDYHGLGLLWSWMIDTRSSAKLRFEILNTLAVLPITNKTILKDSKILSVVEKWAKVSNDESTDNKESNETDDSSPGECSVDRTINEKVILEEDEELERNIVTKATELLSSWTGLKEEFRIPKKERIEQMKEHEREANRGYVDPRENLSYDRHWSYEKDGRHHRESDKERYNRETEKECNSRYNRDNEKETRFNRERKRGRDSPPDSGIPEWRKHRPGDDRHSGPTNRLSKTERRQLFAMKVEEEERQRKMESWAKHQAQMLVPSAPQIDQNFYQQPPFHPPPDGGDLVFGGCPPTFPPPFMAQSQPPPPPFLEGPYPPPQPPGYHQYNPHPPIAPPFRPPVPSYPPFPYNAPPQVYPSAPALSTPTLPAPTLPPTPTAPVPLSTAPPPPPPPSHVYIRLPPKWRSAKDKEGRIYYYHTKTRKSQWQIPTEETAPQMSESESDSDESSDDEDSSSEEEEEVKDDEEYEDGFEDEELTNKKEEEEHAPDALLEETRIEDIPTPISVVTPPALKKRREGLVQVNIISPRDEEDDYRCGIKKKQIRETKERLAKEKKKLRSGGAAKCEADTSVGPRRRKKDLFRVQMANVVVSLLNPYRKSDCKIARITNTEDFKHLARKLTHFVMVKELKHCASVEELECNDNVKHKARDFIRKYMSKFGPIYKRSPDD